MLGTGNTRADRVRRHLAEHQDQSGRPDEVRTQRRPDPRCVGLGDRVAAAAEDRGHDVHQLTRRHALTDGAVHLCRARHRRPATNNQNRPLTPVSTQAGADTVNGWINGVTAGGTTNWDRGLFQVQQSASQFDIAVIITDGNPTVYGNAEGPGNYTRFREVENGIFSANAVKAEGTRMLAFGVGAGISAGGANLAAISGPTAQLGLLPDHQLRGRSAPSCGTWRWAAAPARSPSSSRWSRTRPRSGRSPAPCPPAGGRSARRPRPPA